MEKKVVSCSEYKKYALSLKMCQQSKKKYAV